ncbi:MAG: M23 family metallopeptidase [Candidatus Dormibacteria bacterium]
MAAPVAALAANLVKREVARRGVPLLARLAVGGVGGFLLLFGGLGSVVSAHLAPPQPAPLAGSGCAPPGGLQGVAEDASNRTGVPAAVLLAVACVETSYGRARNRADLIAAIPGDILANVDEGRLSADGDTSRLLGLSDGRVPGNWVNPAPVATADAWEHAMGFMQFLPSTWRPEAAAAQPRIGHVADPYVPLDAMIVAGTYLGDLAAGGAGVVGALAQYGGSAAYAEEVLRIADGARAPGAGGGGRPLDCDPTITQPFGFVPGVYVDGVQVEPLVEGRPFHAGVDLACAAGTPVRSVTDGTAHLFESPTGFGLSVLVETRGPDGEVAWVRYGHLSRIDIPEGATMHPGDQLGLEGSTGSSSGPHLHFEVDREDARSGAVHPVAPCFFLDGHWIDLERACGGG